MIIVIATNAGALDLESIIEPDDLPAQVLKGMDMSHEAYRLEAFDCDRPQDVMTQSIPESCTVKTTEDAPADTSITARQDYTILQKVATFEYPATRCMTVYGNPM